MSDLELLHNCIFILNAGHETTTNLIGNGVDLLIRNPDAMRDLREHPELIESAVEEFLRVESSNQLGNRRGEGTRHSAASQCRKAPTSTSASAPPTAIRLNSRSRPPRHPAASQPTPRLRHRHPRLRGDVTRPHGSAGCHRPPGAALSSGSSAPAHSSAAGAPIPRVPAVSSEACLDGDFRAATISPRIVVALTPAVHCPINPGRMDKNTGPAN